MSGLDGLDERKGKRLCGWSEGSAVPHLAKVRQGALVLLGERLLLSTIGFDVEGVGVGWSEPNLGGWGAPGREVRR